VTGRWWWVDSYALNCSYVEAKCNWTWIFLNYFEFLYTPLKKDVLFFILRIILKKLYFTCGNTGYWNKSAILLVQTWNDLSEHFKLKSYDKEKWSFKVNWQRMKISTVVTYLFNTQPSHGQEKDLRRLHSNIAYTFRTILHKKHGHLLNLVFSKPI
jgi:hypothetical protein